MLLVFGVGSLLAAGMVTGGGFGLAHGLSEKAQLAPVRGWTETSGVIEQVTRHCFRSCVYQAHVRFSDQQGRPYHFVAPGSGSTAGVGSVVRVSYNPDDPRQAHDLSVDSSNWNVEIATMIFLMATGCLLAVGLFAMYRRVRRQAAAPPSPAGS